MAAPRRRKNVKEKKKRGGPLDRVMLSMVGEKVSCDWWSRVT